MSFLDCLVNRTDNGFICSVFRKESFSGLGLSFYSFCTFRFKVNSVKTLLSRAYKVCSNYAAIHEEFQFLKNYFRGNGYSTSFIEAQISKFMSKIYVPPIANVGPSMRTIYFYFPYFGAQSEKLKDELQKLLSKYFIGVRFDIVLVNKFTIGSFFRCKDRLPLASRSSLVYSYSCARCASQYVGMTTRTLGARVSEHRGRSFRTGALLAHPSHSSVRLHADQCDTPISIKDFCILASSNSSADLKILESLFISKLKPRLNIATSSYPLSIVV